MRHTEPSDERRALLRACRWVLVAGLSIGVISTWAFYVLYWTWRDSFRWGTYRDPTTGAAYYEIAWVWGLLALAAFAVAAVTGSVLRWEHSQRRRRTDAG